MEFRHLTSLHRPEPPMPDVDPDSDPELPEPDDDPPPDAPEPYRHPEGDPPHRRPPLHAPPAGAAARQARAR